MEDRVRGPSHRSHHMGGVTDFLVMEKKGRKRNWLLAWRAPGTTTSRRPSPRVPGNFPSSASTMAPTGPFAPRVYRGGVAHLGSPILQTTSALLFSGQVRPLDPRVAQRLPLLLSFLSQPQEESASAGSGNALRV